jgi:hypothetical protein
VVIRVLLAVAIAMALLAASLPAVETARTDRTAAELQRTAERIERAGAALLADEAADAGARRVVEITLRARSLTTAGVERFAVSCGESCAVRYRLHGGTRGTHRLGSLPLSTPAGPVVFSRPGTHRLVLGLTGNRNERLVTVRSHDQAAGHES